MTALEKPKADWALRPATLVDLDKITVLVCEAMPGDPQWTYRFPYREEYPDDHFQFTRQLLLTLLRTENIVIHVLGTNVQEEEEEQEQLVAVAVWKLPLKSAKNLHPKNPPRQVNLLLRLLSCGNQSQSPAKTLTDRRDANPAHMKAFRDSCDQAIRRYFDDVYDCHHLQLRILGTHPDWRRKGAATKLCEWGMNRGADLQVPVTVLSSPMGSLLYTHLEFETLGYFTVQLDGEEEKLTIGVMIRKVKGDVSPQPQIFTSQSGSRGDQLAKLRQRLSLRLRSWIRECLAHGVEPRTAPPPRQYGPFSRISWPCL